VTSTAILASGTVGIFLLLLVVTWYLVPLLQQARKTACAMEELLTSTRPRLDDSLDQLRSLLARADGVIAAVEREPGNRDALLGLLAKIAGNWHATIRTVSTVTALFSGLASVWKMINRGKGPEGPEPTTQEGGTT